MKQTNLLVLLCLGITAVLAVFFLDKLLRKHQSIRSTLFKYAKASVLSLLILSIFVTPINALSELVAKTQVALENKLGDYYGANINPENRSTNNSVTALSFSPQANTLFSYNPISFDPDTGYLPEEEDSFVLEEAIDENTSLYVSTTDSNLKKLIKYIISYCGYLPIKLKSILVFNN
jgi:hypothetical protein